MKPVGVVFFKFVFGCLSLWICLSGSASLDEYFLQRNTRCSFQRGHMNTLHIWNGPVRPTFNICIAFLYHKCTTRTVSSMNIHVHGHLGLCPYCWAQAPVHTSLHACFAVLIWWACWGENLGNWLSYCPLPWMFLFSSFHKTDFARVGRAEDSLLFPWTDEHQNKPFFLAFLTSLVDLWWWLKTSSLLLKHLSDWDLLQQHRPFGRCYENIVGGIWWENCLWDLMRNAAVWELIIHRAA